MTNKLGQYQSAQICKKLLKIIAVDCDQPVRYSQSIPDN